MSDHQISVDGVNLKILIEVSRADDPAVDEVEPYLRRPSALERDAIRIIKDAMAERAMSQSDLARVMDVTPAAVSNALAGHSARGMTLARLERYLAAMGYSAVVTLSARLSS